MNRLLWLLVWLLACCGALDAQSAAPDGVSVARRDTTAPPTKYGVVMEPLASQMASAYRADTVERAWCVTEWSIMPLGALGSRDTVYRAYAATPAHDRGATRSYITDSDCNGMLGHAAGRYWPSSYLPVIHTHPPMAGLATDSTTSRDCNPSAVDRRTLDLSAHPFDALQCSERAFVFYWPDPPAAEKPADPGGAHAWRNVALAAVGAAIWFGLKHH